MNSFFFFLHKQGSIFSSSRRKWQIEKQHYESLLPRHVIVVTNITLLHVTTGFPVRS